MHRSLGISLGSSPPRGSSQDRVASDIAKGSVGNPRMRSLVRPSPTETRVVPMTAIGGRDERRLFPTVPSRRQVPCGQCLRPGQRPVFGAARAQHSQARTARLREGQRAIGNRCAHRDVCGAPMRLGMVRAATGALRCGPVELPSPAGRGPRSELESAKRAPRRVEAA